MIFLGSKKLEKKNENNFKPQKQNNGDNKIWKVATLLTLKFIVLVLIGCTMELWCSNRFNHIFIYLWCLEEAPFSISFNIEFVIIKTIQEWNKCACQQTLAHLFTNFRWSRERILKWLFFQKWSMRISKRILTLFTQVSLSHWTLQFQFRLRTDIPEGPFVK